MVPDSEQSLWPAVRIRTEVIMSFLSIALVWLSLLNGSAFVLIAIRAYRAGVQYPFPGWFRDERDFCLYCAISLLVPVLLVAANPLYRRRAGIAGGISLLTIFTIAWLTSRG
jgi:hypothetical protein